MKRLIVSAYYKIPSKLPHSAYVPYLQNWFASLRAPAMFFTTADVRDEILSWGYDLAHVEFVVLPFTELIAWSMLDADFWQRQKGRDPEPYHTPELGAIWFEKKEFVARAIAARPDEDCVYVWCDAGCVRDEEAKKAMLHFGLRDTTYTLTDGRLHVQTIPQLWDNEHKEFYRYPHVYVAGAIQAGTAAAWRAHSALYNATLNRYDAEGVSCNMDQYILHSCIDAEPTLYVTHSRPEDVTVDEWFFMLATL